MEQLPSYLGNESFTACGACLACVACAACGACGLCGPSPITATTITVAAATDMLLNAFRLFDTERAG